MAKTPPETPRISWLKAHVAIPVMRVFATLLFKCFANVKAIGRYRVPKKGGLIVVANHRSDSDPPILYWSCPRHLYFMSKSELFEMPGVRSVQRFFNAFPVRRGEPDRESIRTAVAYAQAGEAVGIFPEGECSESGEMLPMKPGVALIIRMAKVPVICCGLINTNKLMPYGETRPRRTKKKVRAIWGEPRTFDPHDSAETILGWIDAELASLTVDEE